MQRLDDRDLQDQIKKGKKDYLPLPFLGLEVGGDGGGLFWLMMEREKRERGRNSGLKFFSALGEVQWANGHTRPASQPAGGRAIKGFGWLSLFLGRESASLGLCGAGAGVVRQGC